MCHWWVLLRPSEGGFTVTIDILCSVSNESDVEQKILFPLLTAPEYLAISQEFVKTKKYLAPTQLDKGTGRTGGYYPDYSIWILGHPILIVEAKDPSVSAAVGYREAALYARHLNSKYPSGLNPCHFILASNGVDILGGRWDQSEPVLSLKIAELGMGTQALGNLISFCHNHVLEEAASQFAHVQSRKRGKRPYNLAGGQALLNAKCPLNSFAADLSPILRRYFSSMNESTSREIAERAYVSSAETTEYDRILEALLRDRVTPKRDTIVQPIRTTKKEEPTLTKALREYMTGLHSSGQLQLIQGAVGSGKSLFARRYRDILEPDEFKDLNFWAFIDFNNSPASLRGAERWLCEAFILSFERENPNLELYSEAVLKGSFSRQIQQYRARYEMLRRVSTEEELRARAEDIRTWQSDPIIFAAGIANYIVGGTRKNLIVVMDNVDKLELANQLDAFQLALWTAPGFPDTELRCMGNLEQIDEERTITTRV